MYVHTYQFANNVAPLLFLLIRVTTQRSLEGIEEVRNANFQSQE